MAEKNTSKKEKKQDQLLRVLAVSFAVILLVMALVAVIYYSVPLKQAYRFSLDETELALQLGESADLEPVFTVIDQDKVRRTASRAKRKNVEYRSLDDRVAEVDIYGHVTAKGKGETEITATWAGMTAKVSVRVFTNVREIRFDEKEVEMEVGERKKLEFAILPSNADVRDDVRFSVSDGSLAAVANDGTISSFSAGDVTVTMSLGSLKDTCVVHILSHLERMELNVSELQLLRGETFEFSTRFIPEKITDDATITWTSSDENVARVGDNGFLMAVNYGEADITASCQGMSAVCHVKVRIPLKSITLMYSAVYLEEGKSVYIPVYYRPEDYPHDTPTVWRSTNESVCKVYEESVISENGKVSYMAVVTAVGPGGAEIIGTNGDQMTACTVSCGMSVTSLEISMTDLELEAGDLFQLSARILPQTAGESENIYWISSDPAVASVSGGLVKARNSGTAVISAVYQGFSARCTVRVSGEGEEEVSQRYDGRILVGDSRMVYLKSFVQLEPNDIVIAKGAQYFTWFYDEAVSALRTILNMNPRYEVIICMGVNDCANNSQGWTAYFAENYAAVIHQLMAEYPETHFNFASVGYCNGPYNGTIDESIVNAYIDTFNRYMDTVTGIPYIDLNEYLCSTGYTTLDGVHYDEKTSQKVYDFLKAKTPLN